MPTPAVLADLRRDEGLRLIAYPDPLSGGDPWTIGYGHTGPEVRKGLVWSLAQAEAALAQDAGVVEGALDRNLPWWREMTPARQDVLVNMGFNLGVPGLLKFRATLSQMRAGDYAAAAAGMLASLWARQVGPRARRLAEMMRVGVRTA
ncbi:lysozyme [Caulobacter sp. CCUG 60055]|uniref:glycoside hydrolase family protein n=1 Tax=Caulobacter sp. CCUG 60055 TaxID=2100090 RepID=UPI001FA7E8A7|nr:glycoside hydrolase family protein [Caulobacter sp. CCUG 60055]MCI3182132.1 lysozyme [Caulobacter sp. CCUG 60055]